MNIFRTLSKKKRNRRQRTKIDEDQTHVLSRTNSFSPSLPVVQKIRTNLVTNNTLNETIFDYQIDITILFKVN